MLNPIEKFKRSILHLNRSLHHCYGILALWAVNGLSIVYWDVTKSWTQTGISCEYVSNQLQLGGGTIYKFGQTIWDFLFVFTLGLTCVVSMWLCFWRYCAHWFEPSLCSRFSLSHLAWLSTFYWPLR